MAFSIVRISDLKTTSMNVVFSDDVSTSIGINNVSIVSATDTIESPDIISVVVDGNIVALTYRPLFPGVQYSVTFFSYGSVLFSSINGDVITEDGNRNAKFIVSPGDENSELRIKMIEDLPAIYETEDDSLVRKFVCGMADQFQTIGDSIDTVKSGNYLSVTVEDERHVRGTGPTDSLDNGGTFEILRVGKTSSGSSFFGTLEFNQTRLNDFDVVAGINLNPILGSISADPISLQSIGVVDEVVTDSSSTNNYFDGLRVKLSKNNIIQIISVFLVKGSTTTHYDIEKFGYILKDNRHDTNLAGINTSLEDNEFELSSSSITGSPNGFVIPVAGDVLHVSYIYKNLGRTISSDPEISLTTVRQVVREPAPALINRFFIPNVPIVTSADEVAPSAGVEFLNTQSVGTVQAFGSAHPAFTREITYSLTRTPARPGEYSVNYETGEVLVFGEDGSNTGTGESPPAMSYLYRKIFVKDTDYSVSENNAEVALNSSRDLAGGDIKISFNYEDIFAEGADYKALIHVEKMNERVGNRIRGNKILAQKYPVTDVFRILNETTGELYSTVRFDNSSITFSGRNLPEEKDVVRERITFETIPQESLLISEEMVNSSALRVLKIELQNNSIIDSQNRFLGSCVDSSVVFSMDDIFVNEFFYEDELYDNVETNTDKLTSIGDYLVDYKNGIVYVAVETDQESSIGDVGYKHKSIVALHNHILSVYNIYRSAAQSSGNITTYAVENILDETADIVGLESSGQRFINKDIYRKLVVGTTASGSDGITRSGVDIFTSNSAVFTAEDIGRTIMVGSYDKPPTQQVEIVEILNAHQVQVSDDFSYSQNGRVWYVVDLQPGAEKTIALDYNIVSVKNIFLTSQVDSLPASQLYDFYEPESDTVSGNVITLGSSSLLDIGDEVFVNYSYGDLYFDYRYVADDVVVSYEYGNNSLDWSVSDSLAAEEEYFVSYRFGALRESLLANFGALTQINQLVKLSTNFDRDVYRSIVGGTLKSFTTGPTIDSIKSLVKSFTGVDPNIQESIFTNWTLGKDSLHLRAVETKESPDYDIGRFDHGMSVQTGQNITVPAVSHFKANEGTIETWVRPSWDGLDNDADVSFDVFINGARSTQSVFIGFSGTNPTSIPFTLNRKSSEIYALNAPVNIDADSGLFIWYDDFAKTWNVRWKADINDHKEFSGTISTDGEFFNIGYPVGVDGYSINEYSDKITSSIKTIEFDAFIDGYDGYNYAEGNGTDGMSFASGKEHYIFDCAADASSNRMSIFKDGTGYLNLRVFDHFSNFYNIATNIRDWNAGDNHHIAASWRFNSTDKKDEMHLFVDGKETYNMFKYGGSPQASAYYNYGDIAEETIISSSVTPIVGARDGTTVAASTLFRSDESDFEAAGVAIGNAFYILDDTGDGELAPNSGAPYYVTGVGTTTLQLDRATTLSLGDVSFSVNRSVSEISTPANYQDFVVLTKNVYGVETELRGPLATVPDYTVSRGSDSSHVLSINNGVDILDSVLVKTLGLVFKKIDEKIYVYGDESSTMVLREDYPVSLGDVSITRILQDKVILNDFPGLTKTIAGDVVYYSGYISGFVQPSNQDVGRLLSAYLSGGNINFEADGYNYITLSGTTYSGATTETLTFSSGGSRNTAGVWKYIDSVYVSVAITSDAFDIGVFELRERNSITASDSNGDKAEVVDYSNGLISLEIYGSGGVAWEIKEGWYDISYPSFLTVKFAELPDVFYVGSDYQESNSVDSILDGFRILDFMATDTKTGQELAYNEKTITTDFDTNSELQEDNNTLLLLNFNDSVEDSAKYIDRFGAGYETAESVNALFGRGIKFVNGSNGYVLNNASFIFNNAEGTIEFWVGPEFDTKNNIETNYYVDMFAVTEEEIVSVTNSTIILDQRAREIYGVYLATDRFNTGTNYFAGGTLSNVDRKTIRLGTQLPAQNTEVKVVYSSINNNGDRVSVFKDADGFINFYVKAAGIEHIISSHVDWTRNTWHRVMAMWKTDTVDGNDRLRLFVDGTETGTIKYGTGLLYGSGVIYGQEEVRSGQNRFIVSNIDLSDTFANIYIGSEVFNTNTANAIIDNIRFSNVQRMQSVRIVNDEAIDVNYYGNTSVAIPVAEDLYTTGLYDFDNTETEIVDFATIINKNRGIFKFEVEVIDSFDKVIGNVELEQLLIDLINVIKPAHSEAIVKFSK